MKRRAVAAFAIGMLASAISLAHAQGRILSLNMCTDQLLLDLVAPERIAGLSPFAADQTRSHFARNVRDLPVLSGTAEEVMVLRPELVVSSTFTRRATHEFLRRRGIRVEEFAAVSSIAEAREHITRFGTLAGEPAKAAARLADIDSALAELRAAASVKRLRVLPLSRRGWVAGGRTLLSDLLAEAGLSNAAGELGLEHGGFIGLEAIVKLRPDALLIARPDDPVDQGSAMLLHPAINHLFPPERRLLIPERLTVCGGPMLADAMRILAAQMRQITPRP
jgi:iron complex transport system substrate-binding protein